LPHLEQGTQYWEATKSVSFVGHTEGGWLHLGQKLYPFPK